jgi:hypothetical protein
MKKIRITARAASFLVEWAKSYETQTGPGYVPVITWTVKDSGNPNLIPYLGLAFEKSDVVDRSRIMECDGKDVEIFQYVPDETCPTSYSKKTAQSTSTSETTDLFSFAIIKSG